MFGFLLVKLPLEGKRTRWKSGLALAGLLMPLGILAEVYLGLPFYLVIVGALSILAATILLGLAVLQLPLPARKPVMDR